MTLAVIMLGKFVGTIFLWEGQGHFWIRIKFHLGMAEGIWRRSPKWGLFWTNSHYLARYKLYLTNIWSDKLLITTIVIGMLKHMYAWTFKWFQAILPGQKQLVNICPQYDADVADAAKNYNRVIGIALLKAFSCAKKATDMEDKYLLYKINNSSLKMTQIRCLKVVLQWHR